MDQGEGSVPLGRDKYPVTEFLPSSILRTVSEESRAFMTIQSVHFCPMVKIAGHEVLRKHRCLNMKVHNSKLPVEQCVK